MQRRSPEYRAGSDSCGTPGMRAFPGKEVGAHFRCKLIGTRSRGIALLAVPAIVLGLAAGVVHSAAQSADAAHVEAVTGRVVASSQNKPTLLDVLDVLGDRTQLDLQANSELLICHYQTRKLLKLRGPLRASVSKSDVTADNGKVAATGETCSAPLVSTFQGGIVSRSLAATMMPVALRPSIKLVNQSAKTVRKVALWDGTHQQILATFERNVARPILENGKYYLVVVEMSDGSERKMMLQASEVTRTGPVFLVLR